MGKIIGVTLGMPFEFKMPWPPRKITFYTQKALPSHFDDNDDLYVNLTYLLALEKYGIDITQDQMGKEFMARLDPARLWLANRQAYKNLQAGLLPPKTGHPVFNRYFDSIDAQIENDIWGVLCPGMINTACEYADKASHITNYADGAYGAIFVAAMTSNSFFENDTRKIIEKALKTIPAECDYAKAVRDVIKWHKEDPGNWRATREKIKEKWEDQLGNKGYSAVLNGASVVMALLYSEGDFDKAVTIATMAGWDADCNPSTAGGILGIILGAGKIPPRWNIFNDKYRNKSIRNLPEWLRISELAGKTKDLGEKIISAEGGKIGPNDYILPAQEPVLTAKLERPSPVTRKEKEEWARLRREKLELDLRLWNPDIRIQGCAADGKTGLLKEYAERKHVFRTLPASADSPCKLILKKPVKDNKSFLNLSVSSGEGPSSSWILKIYANGNLLDQREITPNVPARYRNAHIIPGKNQPIVLYIAEDGSTYYDRKLTKLAQAAQDFDPAQKPEPMRIQSGELLMNLFQYTGNVPEESYEMLLEWTDSNANMLWLGPGKLYPFGYCFIHDPSPSLPLHEPGPVKLRISRVKELPYIPDNAVTVLIHDGGKIEKIYLPRVAQKPSLWHELSYDISEFDGEALNIEMLQSPSGRGSGYAYWYYADVARRGTAKAPPPITLRDVQR